MKTALVAALAMAGMAVGSSPDTVAAQGGGMAWLHIRVEEPGKKSSVRVNLPLTVVEAAIKAAPETIAAHGRIKLGPDGKRLSVSDLRQAWAELRKAGDMDLVTVEEEDGTVTVSRKGDRVLVRVDEGRKNEEVHVDVPVALVDAVLAAPGDELDVRAGLAELRRMRGDIVRVRDDDTRVRIWIDESAPQGEK